MRYVWFPRAYALLWLVFLLSVGLHGLQIKKPEQYNKPAIAGLGKRLTLASGAILVVSTLFVFGYSWEQQVVRKGKPPYVELVQRERAYGGTVIERRVPRRIWNALSEGDRLRKPAWSIVVQVERRAQRTSPG
ncbi:MAG: hypothetical protein KatS3mg115_1076 [Candidatus Poribacteria bacterium]|nr:MAG: hypothetical protein KatS3mg115_1076 [Candidatus Poribacteria bacterium]